MSFDVPISQSCANVCFRNEKEVGVGIKASGVPRESFFLTTKLNNDDHAKVKEALDYSLEQLGVPYLDLWLMHWPAPMISPPSLGKADKSIDWLDTWKEMEKVYLENKDKVRAIGVSLSFVSKFNVIYLVIIGVQLLGTFLGTSSQGSESHSRCEPNRTSPVSIRILSA